MLSSPVRDPTCAAALGAWNLNHWTDREIPRIYILKTHQNLKKQKATMRSACKNIYLFSYSVKIIFMMNPLDSEHEYELRHLVTV